MKYSELTFTELVNKIGNSRFFDLPKMLKEVLTRVAPQVPKYKVYTALLTQSGTDAPVATVLENTLGTITWEYNGVGNYEAVSSGLFTSEKTGLLHKSIIGDDSNYLLQSYSITNSSITFGTLEIGTGAQDGILLSPELVEIRVHS